MNLLLFATEAQLRHIAPGDPRLPHIRQVLKAGQGQKIYVGLQGGHRAWATITADSEDDGLRLEPQWETLPPPSPLPLSLLVGLPRPQTAKRVLFEAAVLGVRDLLFFQAQKGEPSYAQSSLWQGDKWREHLLQGAEQACVTTLPLVHHFDSLQAALGDSRVTAAANPARIALDVYEATLPLSAALRRAHAATRTVAHAAANNNSHSGTNTNAAEASSTPAPTGGSASVKGNVAPATGAGQTLALAIGAERGWSANERDVLRQHGFTLAHLGPRVLRTETAVIAALTLTADALDTPALDTPVQ